MSHVERFYGTLNLIGDTDLGRVEFPTIRAGTRRLDPDGTSTVPYIPSLSGKTLEIEVSDETGAVTRTNTTVFTSDDYALAVTEINTAGWDGFIQQWVAVDDNGFLRITSTHRGGNGLLVLLSGTAAPLLGLEVSPAPGSESIAGELPSSPSGFPTQSNPHGTKLMAHDEDITSQGINRSIAGILKGFESIIADLDREFVVPKVIDITIASGVFELTSNANDKLFIGTPGAGAPDINPDVLDNIVQILDLNDEPLFTGDGTRVRVSSITYGNFVDNTQSFAVWGTPDGKSVFGDVTHKQKKIVGPVTITDIRGNMLEATGALFQTNGIIPGNTLLIEDATNLFPCVHNGEFVVEAVHSEDLIEVRRKGTNDPLVLSSFAPAILNPKKSGGEVYGDVSILLGDFVKVSMSGVGSGMKFNLTPAADIADGSYKAVIAMAATLRTMNFEALSKAIIRPFPDKISLGSSLIINEADSLTARITTAFMGGNQDIEYTKMWESQQDNVYGSPVEPASRLYVSSVGHPTYTVNAEWDGVANRWVKDISGDAASKVRQTRLGLVISTRDSGNNNDWIDDTTGDAEVWNSESSLEDSTLQTDVIAATGNIQSIAGDIFASAGDVKTIGAGKNVESVAGDVIAKNDLSAGKSITLGADILDSEANALIPRVNADFSVAASTEYTLMWESLSAALAGARIYVGVAGEIIFTINASWTGTAWTKDVKDESTAASAMSINNADGFAFVYRSASSDTDWTSWSFTPILVTNGEDVSIGGTLSSPAIQFNPAEAFGSLVSASEFGVVPGSGTTLLTESANSTFLVASVVGSKVVARILLPAGAVVSAVEVYGVNTDGATSRTLSADIFSVPFSDVSRTSEATSSPTTLTWVANENSWEAISISGGTYTHFNASPGWLEVHITWPTTDVDIYAVRAVYTMTDLFPRM